MFKENILALNLTSWSERGGRHWYGKLYFQDRRDKPIELKFILDKEEVDLLNKKAKCQCYHIGNKSQRFPSREAVVKCAMEYMKENKLKQTVLVEGDGASLPVFVIWSKNEKLKQELNEIYEKWDKLACKFYGKTHEEKRNEDKLMDEWEEIARKYKILKEWD